MQIKQTDQEDTIYVLDLVDPNWRPHPFPGAVEAVEEGCTCPEHQPWPGKLEIAAECPVHELERAPRN